MTTQDTEFEKWWELPESRQGHPKLSAREAFRAGRIVQREIDAALCDKRLPFVAHECAAAIREQSI